MIPTADLCDARPDAVRIVEPLFRDFGGVVAFGGPISTVKAHEDNTLVRKALEEPGAGRVLVVDGGGSLRCAMMGGNLAEIAQRNGWAGVIVYGCVRDTRDLVKFSVGVKALAAHPLKSGKRGEGQRDIPVTFGGVTFHPGDLLTADEDGVCVTAATGAS